MTSYEIAKKLNVSHFEVMEYWRELDAKIVHNRFLIKCGLCICEETENYLYDCAPSMLLIMSVKFGREFDINEIDFTNAKDFTKGGVIGGKNFSL